MANPWRLKKEYGGGMLNDWATHLVDQVLVIAGVLSCRVEASNNHRIPLPRWSVVGGAGPVGGVVGPRGASGWQLVRKAPRH